MDIVLALAIDENAQSVVCVKIGPREVCHVVGLYGIDIYEGIDLNGDLTITVEVINIIAQSSFDYDMKLTFAVGTVIVNSEEVNEIAI